MRADVAVMSFQQILTRTAFPSEVVDHYNRNAIRGVSDWVLGREKEVSDKFCGPN